MFILATWARVHSACINTAWPTLYACENSPHAAAKPQQPHAHNAQPPPPTSPGCATHRYAVQVMHPSFMLPRATTCYKVEPPQSWQGIATTYIVNAATFTITIRLFISFEHDPDLLKHDQDCVFVSTISYVICLQTIVQIDAIRVHPAAPSPLGSAHWAYAH